MMKVRENKARRWASRVGLTLRKSRAKQWSINNQGGYALLDSKGGYDVAGPNFELDLDDVEAFLSRYEAELRGR